jgi:hypothetical protein
MSIDPGKWWPIAYRLPVLFQDGARRRHYSPAQTGHISMRLLAQRGGALPSPSVGREQIE